MTNPITTLSRERLEEVVSHIHVAGGMRLPEIQEMARALLAVMDARDNSTIRKRKALLWLERQQLANPCMKEVRYAIEIIATPPAPSVPDGWKLVPIELSPERYTAWVNSFEGAYGDWEAMLNAAPATPGGEQ